MLSFLTGHSCPVKMRGMTDDPADRFPERLRARRDDLGLAQEEVARRVGVAVRVYARWEAGETEPRAKHLRRLAQVLATSVEDLYPLAAEAA